LHCGVGNSGLARRFAPRAAFIDGLTVSRREKERADALAIPNYRVYLVSKHSRELTLVLERCYDYIIDNNLASFACCKYHVYLMRHTYLRRLGPGGAVRTAQGGKNWACLDRGFIMDYDALVALERAPPIEVGRVTDTVYSVRAREMPRSTCHVFTSYV